LDGHEICKWEDNGEFDRPETLPRGETWVVEDLQLRRNISTVFAGTYPLRYLPP